MELFSKESDKESKTQATSAFQAIPSGAKPLSAQKEQGTKASATGPASGGQPRAYLDVGSKISGKLSFEGPARIDGQVDGEINAKEVLTIGESAVVTAQIHAGSVIVSGKVSGDIVAAQRIEVRPSAKVLGNLTSPVLVIEEGALFEGHCAMRSEGAHEDHKVTVFPKEERRQQAGAQKQA